MEDVEVSRSLGRRSWQAFGAGHLDSIVVVMAIPLSGFVKWLSIVFFGRGHCNRRAGINSPVLAAHTCSQSRAGAGMMLNELCPIHMSGHGLMGLMEGCYWITLGACSSLLAGQLQGPL